MLNLLLLLLCFFINAFFALSEIALIRSKRQRLERLSKAGNAKARMASNLIETPGGFLSAVQIGITISSILAGGVGAASFSKPLSTFLEKFNIEDKLAYSISFTLIIILISYISLILGELIPKKIALRNPERVALAIAPLMSIFTKIFAPFVFILNASSELPFKFLKSKKKVDDDLWEEEVVDTFQDGLDSGLLERFEHRILTQVFRLKDLPITSLITPRTKIKAIERGMDGAKLKQFFENAEHIAYPVYEKSLDNIVGFVYTQDVLKGYLKEGKITLEKYIRQPLIIPEGKTALEALRLFKMKKSHIALIVDEYGGVKGSVTLRDFLKAMMSEIAFVSNYETPFRRRSDGSWVVSGSLPIETIEERIGIKTSEKGKYKTVAGLVLYLLGRIPKEGDSVSYNNFNLEVIDMDGKRIDKILIIPSANRPSIKKN